MFHFTTLIPNPKFPISDHQYNSPGMTNKFRVSSIIVSYNTKDLTLRAIAKLSEQDLHEIIVVDNASHDGTAAEIKANFPQVILIENESNRGFGAANNQGLQIMTGDLALLLNSDAFPEPGAISILTTVFQNPKIVAAGGRLVHDNGELQQSACGELTLWAVFCEQFLLEKLAPNSPILSPYWQSARLVKNGPGPHEVDQVMGACLMFRPKEQFDERFFLYCEDTELCKRLKLHGKIVYFPEAIFVHDLGASSIQNRWMSVARYNRGKELYFNIHNGPLAALICFLLNRLGALFRLLLWGFPSLLTLFTIAKFRNQSRLWIKVLFAPLNGPRRPIDSLAKPRPVDPTL